MSSKPHPVTIERAEAVLDRLAGFIVRWDGGEELLPLYSHIEKELARMRASQSVMSSVLDRVSRLRDQTEEQSSEARRGATP